MQNEYLVRLYKASFVLLVMLTAFLGVQLLSGLRSYSMMGSSESNTISLSGHGEVMAVPDIASIDFSVEASETTQSSASNDVNTKISKVLDFLKSSGVDEKDIQTSGYNSYPKYSTPTPCPMYYNLGGALPPCSSGDSKIIGYTVSENVNVKIRKVDNASKVIDGINSIGVTNMSGPNFTIDNQDNLKAEARKKAIDDAQTKAKALAKDLGVSLGRIASFSESGGGPIYYGKAVTMDASSGAVPAPAQLPTGQNTITSDVTITYEIR